jgi:RHS repeat-associated protein
MRAFTSSWSNTLRKLGYKASRKKTRWQMSRRPSFELLEERINFSTGAWVDGEPPTDNDTCECDCSPVEATDGDAATTEAGPMDYSSSADPVAILRIGIVDRADEFNDGAYIRADVTVGGGTAVPFYWAGGGGSDVYPGGLSDYNALASIPFNTSGLQTGVYNWGVTLGTYDSEGTLISDDGTYNLSQSQLSTFGGTSQPYYLHVVNRESSPFGNGWSLHGLDRLIIQSGLDGQPDGVALLTSTDELVWFDNKTDDGGGIFSFTREDNPDNFSTLKLDDPSDTYSLTDPDGTVHNFDVDGQLLNVVDRNDNILELYDYDTNGRVIQETDEAGRVTYFAYNTNGLISGITDFYGTSGAETTNYDYTMSGSQVVQMRMSEPDPDGSGPLSRPVATYNYNTSGRLISEIDARGLETDVSYDSVGLVNQIVQRCGGTINITTEESQSAGTPTGSLADPPPVDLPQLAPYRFDYDIGSATSSSSGGFEVVNQYGNTTYLTRGKFGKIIARKDAEGNVTTDSYYANGLPYSVTQPDPNNPTGTVTTTYYYNSDGQITDIYYPTGGGSEHWEYGDFGQMSTYTDPDNNFTWYDIDPANGNVLSMTHVIGQDDRFSSETDDLTTNYTYTDGLGATPIKGLTETVSDPNGNVTHSLYNTQGLVTDVTSAEATGDVTTAHYEYNNRDHVYSATDGNVYTTTYIYDNLDRLIEEDDPIVNWWEDVPVWHYVYDQNGNQTHVIDPLGNDTEYVYDVRNRPFQLVQPVADPDATPTVITKSDASGLAVTGSWSAFSNSAAYNHVGEFGSTTNGASLKYTFTGLDTTKKYMVLAHWTPISTTYDKNALWEVYGNTGSGAIPLNTMRTDLNRKPEGLPDSAGYMWLSLGAFSTYAGSLTVKLSDDDNNGKLMIDAVRLVEVGPVTQTEYDCNGNLVKEIDPLNRVTKYEYDDLNRLTAEKDPDPSTGVTTTNSPTTSYTYNARGWIASVTDTAGVTTVYRYDDMGRQTQQIKLGDEGLSGIYLTDGGEVAHTRLDENIDFDFTMGGFAGYDGLADGFTANWTGAVNIVDPGWITFYLDSSDVSSLSVDDQPVVTNPGYGYMYDTGNGVYLTAGWHTLRVEYDNLSNSPDNGLIVSYDVGDSAGEVVIPASKLRTAEATTITYDDAGNRLSLADFDGNTTTWAYDDINRMTSETIAIGSTTFTRSYQYDDDNNLIQKTDRDGRVTTYKYDHLDRKTAEKWYTDDDALHDNPDSPLRTFDYAYDANSNLVSARETDPAAIYYLTDYEFGYDALNRETSAYEYIAGLNESNVFSRTFDLAGRIIGTNAGDFPFDYANHYLQDNLGRVTTIVQNATDSGVFWWDNAVAGKRVDLTYDAASQLTSIARYASTTTANPVATSDYTFDADGHITYIDHEGTASGSTFSATHYYEVDKANRPTTYSTSVNGVGLDREYYYDGKGQLVEVDREGSSQDEGYTYDADGNRLNGSSDYPVGAYNQVAHDGEYTFQYDAEGNLTRRTNEAGDYTIYTWDHRNRLTEVTQYSESEELMSRVEYTYDAFNQLIGRKVFNGSSSTPSLTQIFNYDNGQVMLQFESHNSTANLDWSNLTHRYLWAPAVDQLLADESVHSLTDAGDNVVLWAMADRQGSISDVIDSNATERLHRVFDSFGNITSETHRNASGTTVTSGTGYLDEIFAYTGRLLDKTTGLQNNLNRWYSPSLGRWMSEDPIGFDAGDANLYRYVGNSPVNYTDPMGEWPAPGSYWWNYFHYANPCIKHHAVDTGDEILQWGTRGGQAGMVVGIGGLGAVEAGLIGGGCAEAEGDAALEEYIRQLARKGHVVPRLPKPPAPPGCPM